MARQPKRIVPFFKMRQDSADTLDALAHELLLTLSAIDTAVQMDTGMNAGTRQTLIQRAAALRAICLSEDGE